MAKYKFAAAADGLDGFSATVSKSCKVASGSSVAYGERGCG